MIVDADEMTAKDLVGHAKVVQGESKASTSRTKQILDQTLAVGVETSAALQKQTEQLANVDQKLDDMESNLKRADKQIRVFLRRMATDKVVMALVFLVIVGIITAVVASITQKKLNGQKIDSTTSIIGFDKETGLKME